MTGSSPRCVRALGNARAIVVVSLLSIGSSACGGSVAIRRFPFDAPMWVDSGDFRAFEPPPDENESDWIWDGADQLFFRKASEALRFERPSESIDVNAMDEVPSSSWYENRASRARIPIARFREGACGDRAPLDPAGPWTIVGGKPGGANPGFMIADARGRRYLLKFDSPEQPERTTTAEVVGSMVYWAAGYHVPCNRIVEVDPDILVIAEDATAEMPRGEEVPFRTEMLESIFDRTTPGPSGRFRASASAILEGEALGPWRYSGRREDDPNDVVPHEDRRELRAGYVLASWILHYDTREQNTLAAWVEGEGGGFVRHHLIDFGDSLGSIWAWNGISRRIGHASYFDVPQVLGDFLSFGGIRRPWHTNAHGLAGASLGYFDVEHFEADEWKPGYPNPAFDRATERDHAWMARIIANITPAHVEAAVDEARIANSVMRDELVRILLGRRERILRRWFANVSPLTWPRLERGPRGTRACLRDLGIATRVVARWDRRPYWTRAYRHFAEDRIAPLESGTLARRRPDQICVDLPVVDRASAAAPAYLIVDVGALDGEDDQRSAPLRMHVYYTGGERYRLVGIERPYDRSAPNER
jgi:hypothetical protein